MYVGKYFFGHVMSPHHSDKMSQGSKVNTCVKIQKWQSPTKGRYRAARAAKNHNQETFPYANLVNHKNLNQRLFFQR